MKKIFIIPILIFLSCSDNKKQDTNVSNNETEETSNFGIENTETDGVTSATAVAHEVTFNGIFMIPPDKHATITLPVNGIVKSVDLLPGKYVKEGDLLVTLEDPGFIDLQQSYLENYAQTEYLEKEFQRQQTLSSEEVASKKKFEQSKAEYLSMKSRRDGNASQLAILGINPSKILTDGIVQLLEIKAPISGYISDMQINTGKFVHAGDALCEIIDKSRLLIKITVYEKDLEKINLGDGIKFRINGMDAKEIFEGVIISVGQQVDNVNRSLEVYAQVKDHDLRFRPGMYVNARIKRE